MRGAAERIPALESAEIQLLLNGPESFTPDGNFILGEAPGLRGYFVAAGFNSGGIAGAGGAGRALAEWIVNGAPTLDLTAYDPRRFLPRYAERRLSHGADARGARPPLRDGVAEQASRRRRGTCCGSPLHERLAERRACFGDQDGLGARQLVRPGGSRAAHGCTPSDVRTGSPTRRASIGRRARRRRSSIRPPSPSSCSRAPTPARCSTGSPPTTWSCRSDGRSTRRFLNARGGYESDLTVSRVGPDAWFVVTGSAQRVRDADWIRRHATPDLRVRLTDRDGGLGDARPHGAARPGRSRAGHRRRPEQCRVPLRRRARDHRGRRRGASDPGELRRRAGLGALRADRTRAARVWDAADGRRRRDAGRLLCARLAPDREGLPRVGTRADAGRHAAAKPGSASPFGSTSRGFIGRDALIAQRARGVSRRLLLFALDDPDAVAWGDEPIYRNDELVGTLTSAAHGHTLGRPVAMGYVRCTPGAPPRARWTDAMRSTWPASGWRPGYRCEPGTIRRARGCVAERTELLNT